MKSVIDKKRVVVVLIIVFVVLCGLLAAFLFTKDWFPKTNSVYAAWQGSAYSESKHLAAIEHYTKNITPIGGVGLSSVMFETGLEVIDCSVVRISRVGPADPESEVHFKIDLGVDVEFEGDRITIDTDWWYDSEPDPRVRSYPVWSYLVCVTDQNMESHWYYFRVDYHKI